MQGAEQQQLGIASIPSGVRQEPDGHWNVGGIYVGRRLNETLFAEPVANRRFLIRSIKASPTFAKRLGEVFGGDGHFQACTMHGDHVLVTRSLIEGAKSLERHFR